MNRRWQLYCLFIENLPPLKVITDCFSQWCKWAYTRNIHNDTVYLLRTFLHQRWEQAAVYKDANRHTQRSTSTHYMGIKCTLFLTLTHTPMNSYTRWKKITLRKPKTAGPVNRWDIQQKVCRNQDLNPWLAILNIQGDETLTML